MSKLGIDEVMRIAKLAHVGLSEAEAIQMTGELEAIVTFVEQLSSVDVTNLEPTDQVTGLVDVMRDDIVRPSMDREAILANAPATKDGYLMVKRVLNG
jgi:aspartyl-tRNA(Asn)/glutamyl-tRNA(Gln) amidotransferase subunit C